MDENNQHMLVISGRECRKRKLDREWENDEQDSVTGPKQDANGRGQIASQHNRYILNSVVNDSVLRLFLVVRHVAPVNWNPPEKKTMQ